MSEEGVWFGVARSQTMSAPLLTQWRDSTVAPAAATLPKLRSVHHYSAFNVTCTATVAVVDTDRPAAPAFSIDPAVDFQSYTAVKRAEFHQPGASDPIDRSPILYSVAFRVPQSWQAEFDDWYEQEHMPMIFGCKEWGLTRRYHFTPNPGGWTHLALHYVLDAKAFDDPALKAARLTPWRAKFLKEPWFTAVEKIIAFKQAVETPAALQKAS